jgi:hypothetical protein
LLPAHAAPDEGCRCGIYAAATATQAAASLTVPARPREEIIHHVIGRVSLWGTVVACERGWRAECAYPASLAVPALLPQTPKRRILHRRRRSRGRPAAEIASALRAYGVPVELVACETVGELASALEARVGRADVSERVLTLSAGIARSLERLMPKVRRLERARFGSLAGRRSVEGHDQIIALCASGEAEAAAQAVREQWLALGALIDQTFAKEDS